jgi:hypothetical protein
MKEYPRWNASSSLSYLPQLSGREGFEPSSLLRRLGRHVPLVGVEPTRPETPGLSRTAMPFAYRGISWLFVTFNLFRQANIVLPPGLEPGLAQGLSLCPLPLGYESIRGSFTTIPQVHIIAD